MADETGFLSRWSRRKVQAAQGEPLAEAPPAGATIAEAPAAPALPVPGTATPNARQASNSSDAPASPPAPTLEEARALTTEADFSRFVARNVDPAVRNTALKTLFSDPHFNVMDGLDTYIDDYSIPDPLPAGMLRRMTQSVGLGLFKDDAVPAMSGADTAPRVAAEPAPAIDAPHPEDTATPDDPATAEPSASATADPLAATAAAHEDTDLRLQPHDAAGHAGDRQGAASQSGRER